MKRPLILIVDDNEPTRYALARHLGRAGYAILEGGSLQEARELLKHCPDLVILDVQLPDGLGYDVCREIKADPQTRAVPVLHMSATFRMSSDRVRGLDSGADGFLTGPVEPEELLANVKLLLRLREATVAMQQSRERLQEVLSSITDVYFSLDADGRFLELNAAAERAFGSGSLVGRFFRQVFPGGTDKVFYTTVESARETGAPAHREGYSAAARGWYETHVYPRPWGVEVYARDISERKETEEKLNHALAEAEQGRQTLQSLMEYIPEGVAIAKGPDVSISMVSRFGLALTGKRLDQLQGGTLDEQARQWGFFHPDGATAAKGVELPIVRATKHGEVVTDEEWVMNRPDGTGVCMLCSAGPIRDSESRLVGGVMAWRDITERKRTEAALRRECEKLNLALSAGQMGAYEVLYDEDRLWWSPQTYRLFQVPPGFEATRKAFADLIHPDDRTAFWGALDEAIRRKELFSHQFRVASPDIPVRWIELRAKAEYDRTGKPVRQFGVALDISIQKSLEQQLEQMVQERTTRLREVIAELESFSYTIAHDMRAPLRSLQGFADILLQEYSQQIDAEGQGFLRRIGASAGRMDKLIQDVLNYSRIVRADLPLENVDLHWLVREILESYPAFTGGGISVEGTLPTVLGNEAMLTQVISNLLGNAFKFVKPGAKPKVRVWAETVELAPGLIWSRERRRVRLFVQDDGIGVPADQQEKIFGCFQRVDKTYEGTGIGLAIVKKAMERMGGQVGIQSEPGKGSTFWVELQRF